MNKYKWLVKEPLNQKTQEQFPEISPVALQLLVDRGLDTQEKIDEFLKPDYSQDIHDPYLFSQMETAVNRLYLAKEKKEKIVIYGDYDADGVCGSSILFQAFKKVGLDFETYLPDREKEGYGLNQKVVKDLADQGARLIVTVDCGISNRAEVELAGALGLEVIITDHHFVPEQLPKALAIIHPRLDDSYPFRDLAGGGVAFKLAQAMVSHPKSGLGKKEREAFEKWLLDLVSISTVADMVPLLGENRTLVSHGLIVLAKTKNLGLQKLMEVGGINQDKLDARTIGFQIAPRINAAGRMAHANNAYQLLTTENLEEAIVIASQLNKRNLERQALTDQLVSQAKEQLGEVKDNQAVLFAWGEGWNPGVIGLVASKITQEYVRPAIVLSFDGQGYVGSGRSIKEFDLIKALDKFSSYFIKFGGHKGAAGFSLTKDKFEDFKFGFEAYAKQALKGVELTPSLLIDKTISLAEVDWPLVEILEQFKPYGMGNYQPRFLIKDLAVEAAETVGATGNHLRLMVKQGDLKRKIICFGFGEICEQLKPGDMIEAVCEVGVNQYNGNKELQLSLIDLKKK